MKQGCQSGFTLIEVTIAMLLLTVSLLGLALTIPVALQSNHRNRLDSEATQVAQWELEQMAAQPLTATSFTDTAGNNVSLAAGGSPLANGVIDYSQAAVTGYQAVITDSTGVRFDLRWNVQSLADGARQFTVAARRQGVQRFLLPAVNLSLRVAR